MKKMILSALVFAFAASAFAGNEGPQAVPKAPPTVLVVRSANGGFFVPPGHVASRQIQILSDGNVIRLEWIRGENEPTVTPIVELTEKQTAKVAKLVAAVKPGKMVAENPDAPGCMDGPSFNDAVFQGETRIVIAQTSACKKYKHENATAADAQLIKILSGLEKIK